MFGAGHDVAFGRAVGSEFVGDHHTGCLTLSFQKLSHQKFGSLSITAMLQTPFHGSDISINGWRRRSFESQAFRASGLNLVVSAIVHWNTVYIERAVTHLRNMRCEIPDHLLKHISPLSWEHINLTGIYTWDSEQHLPEGFRSLRLPAVQRRAA